MATPKPVAKKAVAPATKAAPLTPKSKIFWDAANNRAYYGNIVTGKFPIAWPNLNEPRASDKLAPDGNPYTPRYEFTVVLSKDSAVAVALREQLGGVVAELAAFYNENVSGLPKVVTPSVDDILKDGDDENKYPSDQYPYYKEAWLMVLRNTKQPVFKNYKGETFYDGSVFQGGDICNCEITPNFGPTGLSFKVRAVQLIKRGEVAMGGGAYQAGKLLTAEEDGEDLVDVGAPAPAPAAIEEEAVSAEEATQATEDYFNEDAAQDQEAPADDLGSEGVVDEPAPEEAADEAPAEEVDDEAALAMQQAAINAEINAKIKIARDRKLAEAQAKHKATVDAKVTPATPARPAVKLSSNQLVEKIKGQQVAAANQIKATTRTAPVVAAPKAAKAVNTVPVKAPVKAVSGAKKSALSKL